VGLHPCRDRAEWPVVAGRDPGDAVCGLRDCKEKGRPILTTSEGYWQRLVTGVVTSLVTVETFLEWDTTAL
jgi:hypothetical protein